MQIGLFARTLTQPTPGELFDAISGFGVNAVQFNFSCVRQPTLPERIDPRLADLIQREAAARKLSISAVSATFNLIHPNFRIRQDGLMRLRELAAACARMRVPVMTLCTGTRDPENMWRRHPANDLPAAWHDLLPGVAEAVAIAETHNLILGIEPEPGNVVSSARKARLLLDEIESPRLKIVMDAANLIEPGNVSTADDVLREAFDLLGPDIALVHAKDVAVEGGFRHVAAGRGVLDYDLYLSLLEQSVYTGPLILHELQESEVVESVTFLRRKLELLARGWLCAK